MRNVIKCGHFIWKHILNRKGLATATALIFLSSTISAPLAEANFWKERVAAKQRAGLSDGANRIYSTPAQVAQLPASQGLLPWNQKVLNGLPVNPSVAIPSSVKGLPDGLRQLLTPYADIHSFHLTKSFSGADWSFSKTGKSPLIVLIQDAHDVPEAQRNIALLLKDYQEQLGLNLIGLEGARGGFQLAPYRALSNQEAVRQISDYLLDSRLITGAEYFGLTASHEPALWGIEDEPLYLANIDAFRNTLPYQKPVEDYETALAGVLSQLKSRIYGAELKAADSAVSRYADGSLSLSEYISTLSSFQENAMQIPSRFPNIAIFQKAMSLEKTLDFQKAEAERNDLIKRLTTRLAPEELSVLLDASLRYRQQQIGFSDYHESLKALAAKHGISLDEFPQLNRYVEYVSVAEHIDRQKFLSELSGWETAVCEGIAKTAEQRDLLRLSHDAGVLHKLLRHNFTTGDWNQYRQNKEEFEKFSARLSALARSAGISVHGLTELPAPLPAYEDFYRRASDRNETFVHNLSARMESSGERSAVLVAGGFHTDGLCALLAKHNLSYVVLTPRIAKVDPKERYLDVFARGRTPLEKLMLGEKLFIHAQLTLATDPAAGYAAGTQTVLRTAATAYVADEAQAERLDPALEELRRNFPGIGVLAWIQSRKPFTVAVQFVSNARALVKIVIGKTESDIEGTDSALRGRLGDQFFGFLRGSSSNEPSVLARRVTNWLGLINPARQIDHPLSESSRLGTAIFVPSLLTGLIAYGLVSLLTGNILMAAIVGLTIFLVAQGLVGYVAARLFAWGHTGISDVRNSPVVLHVMSAAVSSLAGFFAFRAVLLAGTSFAGPAFLLAVAVAAAVYVLVYATLHLGNNIFLPQSRWLSLSAGEALTQQQATEMLSGLPLTTYGGLRDYFNNLNGRDATVRKVLRTLKATLTPMADILRRVRQHDGLDTLLNHQEQGDNTLTEPQLDILRAVSEFAFQLTANDLQFNSRADAKEALDKIKAAFVNYPHATKALVDYFEARFNPDATRREEERKFQQILAAAVSPSAITDDHDRRVFLTAIEVVNATTKTDYFVEGRISLGLRIDPKELKLLYGYAEYASAIPFVIMWVHMPYGGYGAHIRFQDVARGGLREKNPNLEMNPNHHQFRNRILREAFELARTQELKNVDIPEGGSKGVYIFDPELNQVASVVAYVDALINFMQANPQIIYRGPPGADILDPLEFGPDEGTNFASGIVSARAQQKGLRSWKILMSAKPANPPDFGGTPHMQNDLLVPPVKGNRVTSQGVMTHLDETWKWLRLDPSKVPVSIKFTGGLDGDVGSGDIEIAIRRYGDNVRIVSIADGRGVAFDPDGLDHEELMRLYEGKLTIDHFDTTKLHRNNGAFVAAGSGSSVILGPETLARLNTRPLDPKVFERLGIEIEQKDLEVLKRDQETGRPTQVQVSVEHLKSYIFFMARADAFVPGGGAPNTINQANVRLMNDEAGIPTVRAIVYGANTYTEPAANKYLESIGIFIVPDEKANSVGVEVSSRMEVDFNLLWPSGRASLLTRRAYFGAVLEKLLSNAVKKNWALRLEKAWRGFMSESTSPSIVTEISPAISQEIVRLKNLIIASDLLPSDPRVSHYIREYFPMVASMSRIFRNIPEARLKAILATAIASDIVYNAGTHYVRETSQSTRRSEMDVILAYVQEARASGLNEAKRKIFDQKNPPHANDQLAQLVLLENDHQKLVHDALVAGDRDLAGAASLSIYRSYDDAPRWVQRIIRVLSVGSTWNKYKAALDDGRTEDAQKIFQTEIAPKWESRAFAVAVHAFSFIVIAFMFYGPFSPLFSLIPPVILILVIAVFLYIVIPFFIGVYLSAAYAWWHRGIVRDRLTKAGQAADDEAVKKVVGEMADELFNVNEQAMKYQSLMFVAVLVIMAAASMLYNENFFLLGATVLAFIIARTLSYSQGHLRLHEQHNLEVWENGLEKKLWELWSLLGGGGAGLSESDGVAAIGIPQQHPATVTENYEEMSQAAADLAMDRIKEKVLRGERFVFGLATGETQERFLAILSQRISIELTAEQRALIHTVHLDEYVGLPADHEQSYQWFLKVKFLTQSGIPEANWHFIDASSPNLEQAAADYEALIRELGGVDLQMLGIGNNGHIAFNEPNSPFDSRTRVVDLTLSTIRANARFFFSWWRLNLYRFLGWMNVPQRYLYPGVPRQAVTQGIGTILEAKELLLLASGRNKAPPVHDLLLVSPTPAIPATALQNHPKLTVIITRSAAEALLPASSLSVYRSYDEAPSWVKLIIRVLVGKDALSTYRGPRSPPAGFEVVISSAWESRAFAFVIHAFSLISLALIFFVLPYVSPFNLDIPRIVIALGIFLVPIPYLTGIILSKTYAGLHRKIVAERLQSRRFDKPADDEALDREVNEVLKKMTKELRNAHSSLLQYQIPMAIIAIAGSLIAFELFHSLLVMSIVAYILFLVTMRMYSQEHQQLHMLHNREVWRSRRWELWSVLGGLTSQQVLMRDRFDWNFAGIVANLESHTSGVIRDIVTTPNGASAESQEERIIDVLRGFAERNPLIKGFRTAGQGEEEILNPLGSYHLVVRQESMALARHSLSVGTLISIYDNQGTLLGSVFYLNGPIMTITVSDGKHTEHYLAGFRRRDKEIDMSQPVKDSSPAAIGGTYPLWPEVFQEYFWAKPGIPAVSTKGDIVLKTRYGGWNGEPAMSANMYEILLNNGFLAEILPAQEAAAWAQFALGGKGRAICLTDEGQLIDLSVERIPAGVVSVQLYAGNKSAVDLLETKLRHALGAASGPIAIAAPAQPAFERVHYQLGDTLEEFLGGTITDQMGSDYRAEFVAAMGAVQHVAAQIPDAYEGGGRSMGTANASGDEQKEIDEQAEALFVQGLKPHINAYYSEEGVEFDDVNKDAHLSVAVDPLDGSSKVETNGGGGTIGAFIYNPDGGRGVSVGGTGKTGHKDVVASFFITYGVETRLFLAIPGKGTHEFLLIDGKFRHIRRVVLPAKPSPEAGLRIALGGSRSDWPAGFPDLVDEWMQEGAVPGYSGALVTDAVGVLSHAMAGGRTVFAYLAKKLRHRYEEIAIAMIMEEAGGASLTYDVAADQVVPIVGTNGSTNVLDREIGHEQQEDGGGGWKHQKAPFAFGDQASIAQIGEKLGLASAAVPISAEGQYDMAHVIWKWSRYSTALGLLVISGHIFWNLLPLGTAVFLEVLLIGVPLYMAIVAYASGRFLKVFESRAGPGHKIGTPFMDFKPDRRAGGFQGRINKYFPDTTYGFIPRLLVIAAYLFVGFPHEFGHFVQNTQNNSETFARTFWSAYWLLPLSALFAALIGNSLMLAVVFGAAFVIAPGIMALIYATVFLARGHRPLSTASKFDLNVGDMRRISDSFAEQMETGLGTPLVGKKHVTVPMYPTYAIFPTGMETGFYITLEIGGTNIRTHLTELLGNGKMRVVASGKTFQFTDEQKTGDGRVLFDLVAAEVKRFIDSQKMGGDKLDVGFIFSFPMLQTAIDRAELDFWTKRITATNVVGEDVVALLQASLNKAGAGNVRVRAIANDTVGTQFASIYRGRDRQHVWEVIRTTFFERGFRTAFALIVAVIRNGRYLPAALIGLIVGTGHNMSITLNGETFNMESGGFDPTSILGDKFTKYDRQLKKNLPEDDPGNHHFEYMTTGGYMGEIVRLMVKDDIRFLGWGDSFDVPYALNAGHLTDFLQDKSANLDGVNALLKKLGVADSTLEQRRLLQDISYQILRRSARLMAAAVAAAARKADPGLKHGVVVAVDGTVYEKGFMYKKMLFQALEEFMGKQQASRIWFDFSEGGSSLGGSIIPAAVKAAAAARESVTSVPISALGQRGLANAFLRKSPIALVVGVGWALVAFLNISTLPVGVTYLLAVFISVLPFYLYFLAKYSGKLLKGMESRAGPNRKAGKTPFMDFTPIRGAKWLPGRISRYFPTPTSKVETGLFWMVFWFVGLPHEFGHFIQNTQNNSERVSTAVWSIYWLLPLTAIFAFVGHSLTLAVVFGAVFLAAPAAMLAVYAVARYIWNRWKRTRLTLKFRYLDEGDVDIAGGKGANLAKLENGGVPVPTGYTVTAYAFVKFLEHNGLLDMIQRLTEGVNVGNAVELAAVSQQIREALLAGEFPDDLRRAIIREYAELNEYYQRTDEELPVAVRSSGTREDLEEASSAGIQATFLNEEGRAAVLRRVKDDFASLYLPRAISYRDATLVNMFVNRLGEQRFRRLLERLSQAGDLPFAIEQLDSPSRVPYKLLHDVLQRLNLREELDILQRMAPNYIDPRKVSMAVPVQAMMQNDRAFTVFSVDNRTGWSGMTFQGVNAETLNEGRVFRIESIYNLGEALVGGKTSPDSFLVHVFTDDAGVQHVNILGKDLGSKKIQFVRLQEVLRELDISLEQANGLLKGLLADGRTLFASLQTTWGFTGSEEAFVDELRRLMRQPVDDESELPQQDAFTTNLSDQQMRLLAHLLRELAHDPNSRTVETVVPRELRSVFSVTDEEVKLIALESLHTTEFYGDLRDIEGGMVNGRPEFVQSRPYTAEKETDTPRLLALRKMVVPNDVAEEAEEGGRVLATGVTGRNAYAGRIIIIDEDGGLIYEPGHAPPLAEQIKRVQDEAERARARGETLVLLTKATTPDYNDAIKATRGIIALEGGDTSHAAIVSRELKIPAVVGIGDYLDTLRGQDLARWEEVRRYLLTEGNWVTVDANRGRVFEGQLEVKPENIVIDLDSLPPLHFTKPGLIIASDHAMRELSPLAGYESHYGVSLARAEFFLMEIGIHPWALEAYDNIKLLDQDPRARLHPDPAIDAIKRANVGKLRANPALIANMEDRMRGYSSAKDFYVSKLSRGIASIAAANGIQHKVLYRFTDFKQNEMNKMLGGPEFGIKEDATMEGHRGAGYLLDEENRVTFEWEEEALKAAIGMGYTNIGVFFPFVRTPDELRRGLERLKEDRLMPKSIGMMVELPSNVMHIDDYIEILERFEAENPGIETFLSFGTNDLTQLTRRVGRDEPAVKGLFRESDNAVIASIRHVVYAVQRARLRKPDLHLTVGLCGQAIVKLANPEEPGYDPVAAKEIISLLDSGGTDALGVLPFIKLAAEAEVEHAELSDRTVAENRARTIGTGRLIQGPDGVASGRKFHTARTQEALQRLGIGAILYFPDATKSGFADEDLDAAVNQAGAVLLLDGQDGPATRKIMELAAKYNKPLMLIGSDVAGKLVDGKPYTVDFARGLIFSGEIVPTKKAATTPDVLEDSGHLGTPQEASAHYAAASDVYRNVILFHPRALLDYDNGELRDEPLRLLIADALRKAGVSSAKAYFQKAIRETVRRGRAATPAGATFVYQTSDLTSADYRALQGGQLYEAGEANPPLGFGGLYRLISEHYLPALDWELEAIRQELSDHETGAPVAIEFTDVRDADHLRAALERVEAADLKPGKDVLIGIRIDNPDNYLLPQEYMPMVQFFSVSRPILYQQYLAADMSNAYIPVTRAYGTNVHLLDPLIARVGAAAASAGVRRFVAAEEETASAVRPASWFAGERYRRSFRGAALVEFVFPVLLGIAAYFILAPEFREFGAILIGALAVILPHLMDDNGPLGKRVRSLVLQVSRVFPVLRHLFNQDGALFGSSEIPPASVAVGLFTGFFSLVSATVLSDVFFRNIVFLHLMATPPFIGVMFVVLLILIPLGHWLWDNQDAFTRHDLASLSPIERYSRLVSYHRNIWSFTQHGPRNTLLTWDDKEEYQGYFRAEARQQFNDATGQIDRNLLYIELGILFDGLPISLPEKSKMSGEQMEFLRLARLPFETDENLRLALTRFVALGSEKQREGFTSFAFEVMWTLGANFAMDTLNRRYRAGDSDLLKVRTARLAFNATYAARFLLMMREALTGVPVNDETVSELIKVMDEGASAVELPRSNRIPSSAHMNPGDFYFQEITEKPLGGDQLRHLLSAIRQGWDVRFITMNSEPLLSDHISAIQDQIRQAWEEDGGLGYELPDTVRNLGENLIQANGRNTLDDLFDAVLGRLNPAILYKMYAKAAGKKMFIAAADLSHWDWELLQDPSFFSRGRSLVTFVVYLAATDRTVVISRDMGKAFEGLKKALESA